MESLQGGLKSDQGSEAMNPFKLMNVVQNQDGSLTVPADHPFNVAQLPATVRFSYRDITFNRAHDVWLRIYRPHQVSPGAKLPVMFYFHSGSFILFSSATPAIHAACGQKAEEIPAIVVSANYRLAPQHRLPAAYNDASDAIKWVNNEWVQEPWLRDLGDPTRCFLMGSSAGGNIAYHVALRAKELHLHQVQIAGLILNQPYLGGVERTPSELMYGQEGMMSLPATDFKWELALPEGADRDHEFCNLDSMNRPVQGLPRCMVNCYGRDPVVDRQRELVRVLRDSSVEVIEHFKEDGYHGVDYLNKEKGLSLLMDVKKFVLETK